MASENPYFSKKIIKLFFLYTTIAFGLWISHRSFMIEPAVEKFFYSNSAEQEEIAKQLIRMDQMVVRPLTRMLYFADSTTFWKGIEILHKIDPSSIRISHEDDLYANSAKFHLTAGMKDTTAITYLIGLLNYSSIDTQIDAAKTLGSIGSKTALDPLVKELGDSNPLVRIAVIEALINIGDLSVVEPLVSLLETGVYEERLAVIKALGQLGDARAVDPLIAAYRKFESSLKRNSFIEFNENLIGAVCDALGTIGSTKARSFLLSKLTYSYSNLELRVLAGLGKCGNSTILWSLYAYPGKYCKNNTESNDLSHDGEILSELVNALAKIDKTAVKSHYLRQIKRIGVKKSYTSCTDIMILNIAFKVTAIAGDKAAINYLSRYYRSDLWIAAPAIEAASFLGDTSAIMYLFNRMETPDENLPIILATLQRMGDQRAVSPLIMLLNSGKSDMDRELVWLLGELDDKRAVETILDYERRSWKELDWNAAMFSLTRLGDESFIEPCIDLFLFDPDYMIVGQEALANSKSLQALRILTKIVRKGKESPEHIAMAAKTVNKLKANKFHTPPTQSK